MARGTDFGGVHSSLDLHLIQQSVAISPAEPKLNFIDIPGADGSKDLSTSPAGRVVYKDRSVQWAFALYPGDRWEEKQRQVSRELNGRRCRITLDTDPDYYFDGRLTVKSYKRNQTLRQIIVEAICRPYMLKQQHTTVLANISAEYTALTLRNECKPVIPTITVTAETTLRWGGFTTTIPAGTHKVLDIQLETGDNLLEAKTTSGTGTITITYQEGAL